MTQFHDWEFFTGEAPTGKVQIWLDGWTREKAEDGDFSLANVFIWDATIIAYRRVKEPVRGEVSVTCDINSLTHSGVVVANTHRLTLPTEDGALICGEYVGPGGAVVKVARLATEDDGA